MSVARQFKRTRIAPHSQRFSTYPGQYIFFYPHHRHREKQGASILLRIDDMDQERAQEQYLQDMFDTLNFLELPWDEGPRNSKAIQR